MNKTEIKNLIIKIAEEPYFKKSGYVFDEKYEYVSPQINDKTLAGMIDHTLLKPDAIESEITVLCEEALKYKFASVCVNPSYVKFCSEIIKGSHVKVCTVIGFPLGATTTESKQFEAEEALSNGAGEIDMVINIGKLKNGEFKFVFDEIKLLADTAKRSSAICKVILETALLTDEEKIIACIICKQAGAGFVKTSTGFSKSGATAEDIALMRYVVGNSIGVKASGGIRTREDAEIMIKSGASRIGASAGIKIVAGGNKADGGY